MARTLDELDAAVRRIQDRQEIIELSARYGNAVDDRDFDALGRVYATDAVFDTPRGRNAGREDVVAFYRVRLPDFGPTVHTPHSFVIEFDSDDTAHGVVTSHAELAIDGKAFITAFRYHDRYVREAGEWRFRERKVVTTYALPLDELPEGLAEKLRKRWPGTEPLPAELPESLDTYQQSLSKR